jgi:Outer membrane protein (OmpH-like)
MRTSHLRLRPEVIVGIVSGYLFCDTFYQALALFSPAFGVYPKWWNLTPYVLAPFVVLLSVTLAFGSRRAWILTQVYLVVRIAFRLLAALIALWQYSHAPSMPKGLSAPSLYLFRGVQLIFGLLVSVLLLALLRRGDVKDFFRVSPLSPPPLTTSSNSSSSVGLAGFVIATAGVVIWLFIILLAALGQAKHLGNQSPLMIAVALAVFAMMAANAIGAVLGFMAISKKNQRKTLTIIGLTLNLIELFGFIFLIVIGLSNQHRRLQTDRARLPAPISEIRETPTPVSTATPNAPHGDTAGIDPAFAFVDMNKIFKAYYRTKNAEEEISEAKDAATKKYNNLITAHKGANEILNFRISQERQLQDQALKTRQEIVAEMTAKVKNLGDVVENLIFDKGGNSLNGVPLFIFSPEKADMSQRVIAALNQNQNSSFVPSYELQLGLTDLNKIFKAFTETKDAEVKINDAKAIAKKEYDDRAAIFKQKLDTMNKMQNGARKDQANRDLKALEGGITEFRQAREKQLQEQALKMREGIVADITKLIGDRLINSADCVIVDSSGNSLNGVPIVLYARGLPDFSDEVISALNQGTRTGGSILPPNKPFVSSKTLRVGKIDMTRAFKALPESKEAENEISAAKAQAARDLGDKPDPKVKEAKDKELQATVVESRKVIISQITAGLSPVAGKGGFNLIFDSSGNSLNGVPVLIASRDIPDLTDEVIAKVQAR